MGGDVLFNVSIHLVVVLLLVFAVLRVLINVFATIVASAPINVPVYKPLGLDAIPPFFYGGVRRCCTRMTLSSGHGHAGLVSRERRIGAYRMSDSR